MAGDRPAVVPAVTSMAFAARISADWSRSAWAAAFNALTLAASSAAACPASMAIYNGTDAGSTTRCARYPSGLPAGDAVTLDFKWWDNPQKPGDIMDVYLSGDAAPDGRFNFRYSTAPLAP